MVQFEPTLVKTYNTHSNNRTVCYVHLWVFVSTDASDGDINSTRVLLNMLAVVCCILHTCFLCECASMPSACIFS